MSAVDTGHRDGCAFGRTARCTCTYLAQWDRTPGYTAPAFSGGPDKPDPDTEVLNARVNDAQLRAKYWHGEYLHMRRSWWIAVGFASVCAAGLGTALSWAGVL